MVEQGLDYVFNRSKPEGDCIIWQKAKNAAGYPVGTVERKTRCMHLFVLEQVRGPAPKGNVAYQRCGRRDCVNPGHLVWRPSKDSRAGPRPNRTLRKLTDEQVLEIRSRLESGQSCRLVAMDYPVTAATIAQIKRSEVYGELVGDPLPFRRMRPRGLDIHELADYVLENSTQYANGCIICSLPRMPNGYCTISGPLEAREQQYAHRVVCTSRHGPRPSDKHVCTITCGNKNCVNPDHLKWTTYAESCRYRDARKTEHLTPDDVLEIRRRAATGQESDNQIAQDYPVSGSGIHAIRTRRTWAWLED